MRRTILLLVPVLLAACASGGYESPRFAARAADHEVIAVLPFEMIFQGKAPTNLTVEQIERIEEAESLAFQAAFYDHLLYRSSARRRRPILIEIQPVAVTHHRLEEHGIGVRESWALTPEELAEVLGVDAVVRTTVIKTRYLSDLASYGIDLGVHVLHDVAEHAHVPLPLPPGLARTHDIRVESMLCDGGDGTVLWKLGIDTATDWQRPANHVVAGVTGKLARRFPYRQG